MAHTARSIPGQSAHFHNRQPIVRESLFVQPSNYALILLLFSLVAYSSIGLAITAQPVQAETQPVLDQPSQASLSASLDEPVLLSPFTTP